MGIAEDKVKKYLAAIKKENGKINAVLHVNEHALSEAKAIDQRVAKTGKKGRLYGYVIGVKSCINVSGLIANCASKTLENYKATYDSAVIEKIKVEDGVIIGMLNMDEFASGISGENSAFGATQNPSAPGYIPGGSSSGSAAAVAAGFCDVALGSDTGGSIRNPSGHCGVVGAKPSYGLVSRYGLIDLSMSLDQVGVVAKTVSDATLLLDVIHGRDERDAKTFDSGKIEVKSPGKIKIGVLHVKGVDKKVQKLSDEFVEKAVKKFGWTSKEVEIKCVELAVQTYYLLVYSEFFSATRRFDGRRYGHVIENTAGPEVLRRIFGGSEITKAEHTGRYYQKALAVKEIIKQEFERAFKNFDCVIAPTCPVMPWKMGKSNSMSLEQIYAADALTIPANLAEICALSLPAGKIDNIPVGMQIMCAKGQESKMFSIASEFEKLR